MIEKMIERTRCDDALLLESKLISLNFGIVIDDRHWLIRINRGEISAQYDSPEESGFILRASSEVWNKFARNVPPVGFHDILGMFERGVLTLEGDMLVFFRYLRFTKKVLEKLRPDGYERKPARSTFANFEIEQITGRYVHIDIEGRRHRIYYEEAGVGTPLLCLHTSGSDGRQYRAVLNDSAITSRFRVIAFDLPRHGRSSPPAGWHKENYQLTSALYIETILAFVQALSLDRPVVMGCSIGGRVVVELASQHAESFRAAIGLQSHLGYTSRIGPLIQGLDYLGRPDVNAQEAAIATQTGMVSPTSPEHEIWETLWYSYQSGPGVLAGDLHYYMVDGDLREKASGRCSKTTCPLFIMTGEYDYSGTVERAEQLLTKWPGATITVMKDIGHFSMSENPQLFLSYLRPVLEKIVDHEDLALNVH